MAKKDQTFWNIGVHTRLNELVEKAVKVEMMASKAEFIRAAVKEKLRRLGLLANGPVDEG